mmetsp:Transcript_22668/g.37893  ORF Transcript_22668/g.37893 Transcript_22668/m.37893 type:complete len:102 (-) Transcript_22668:207-512(-)
MGLTTNFFGIYKGEMFSTEPATGFDPEKPWADPVAGFEQREYVVREKMVEVAKCQIIRDRLQDCVRKEGVNHYEHCKELSSKYVSMIKGVGVHRINLDARS